MKTRFNTYDIVCSVTELQKLVGMRVNQIYDIDHKTYLIRFQKSEEKSILLLESGSRMHTTAFEWPKNVAPSGFSMKMRKHLKNKRLESLKQIGVDRIIDLQFGSNEAAYHIILELYDRGNIVLTDCDMTIINILRPHTEGDKIRLAVKEKYPTFRAHTKVIPSQEELSEIMKKAKEGDALKKVLNPHLEVGAAVIDHVLLEAGFQLGCKVGKDFIVQEHLDKLYSALLSAEKMLDNAKREVAKGYVIQKKEPKAVKDNEEEFIYANIEFHPFLFEQCKNQPHKEYETFDKAVDEYFSTMEGQKLDLKVLQQERDALKKLENVKKDHDKRLIDLQGTQEGDKQKAELITRNQELVDRAILAVQSALANQMSWQDIDALLKEAQITGDPVACAIKKLKLESNHISLLLTDPYGDSEDEPELKPMTVDIDLAHSAFGNATRYYDQKRSAAKKQQKTIESQGKALKSAERKTKQTLKEVQAIHSINKARKVYWFEKFYWFITSENYLVIGGRDQQQNELIVKRYLRAGDIYVHADLSGASSIVIKNPNGGPVPPKTLYEAGTMAVAYSIAWEAKVIAGAWWVNSDQVSKTAPTGEYLTTGSFMIRGKKNYLPPCQLIMGLGFLFRLEDSSIERHKNERRVRTLEDGDDVDQSIETYNDIEIEDGDDDDEKEENLQTINEEAADNLNDESVENDKDDSGDDSEKQSLFPDTQIKLDLTGPKVKIQVDDSRAITKIPSSTDNVVFLGDDKPVPLNTVQNKDTIKSKSQKVISKKEDDCESQTKQNQQVLKRGQRGKLKKIKEKYKDQDEEDRKLLMTVLQSAGAAKEDKRKSKNKDPSGPRQQGKKKGPPPKTNVQQRSNDINVDNLDEEDAGPAPEVDMLDQLTGKPLPEDELLFAVPVVAPYSTLQSYKFKVKLTPGTGKRGKAAKTAVAVFLKDKSISPREKDLLKSVKDETIARNICGKVKISAPQITKLKK